MKTLAVIAARGNSKRLPGKNLRELGTKPLIGWTIEAALRSTEIDRVIVTTDDVQIAEVSKAFGAEVPFIRDPGLATDIATSADTMHDVLSRFRNFDCAILLQPTSPFRTHEHIDSAFRLLKERSAKSLVSVQELHADSSWLLSMDSHGFVAPISVPGESKSQKMYVYNGAMYIVDYEQFLRTRAFVNSETLGFIMDSASSLDIDTIEDFRRAEAYLNSTR